MNEISSTLTGEIYTKKHKSGVTNIFIEEKETVSKIKKKRKSKYSKYRYLILMCVEIIFKK